jgi:hypothetical protein
MSLNVILMSAALLLSPFGTAAGKQEHDDWVKFTSPEATFSVLLPHQPTLEVVSDSSDAKSTHNSFSHYEKEYFYQIEPLAREICFLDDCVFRFIITAAREF